jgi:hydrogenase maturation protein HypF
MNRQRARITVRGAVQGVGFRPFVYRLAGELGLGGWVLNSAQGVSMEVEGAEEPLRQFRSRLESDKPGAALIQTIEMSFLKPSACTGFEILPSQPGEAPSALILPDLATCPDCLREIFDPVDRRYLYPFTNCTHCGPRFSIIEALPYDRANTSMKRFRMCSACEREYHDPRSRRLHAQPNACPECGPRLELWDACGKQACGHVKALEQAAEAIRAGQVLALKGTGGFQLIVDARNEAAVRRLRERKRRPEKPFALMFPSLEQIREICKVSDLEKDLLLSPESPIVLLDRFTTRSEADLAAAVAPGNPTLGVMLPYSPMHHLLLCALGFPIVATSGNVSDEPICTDEHDALERLRGIADLFLVHNRPIVRHMDDSIVRVVAGEVMVLRRARGYAPLPFSINSPDKRLHPDAILAAGAHQKNTIALSVGEQVFVSQHLGDLETEQAVAAFRKSAADLPGLYDADAVVVACDLHPDYVSTAFAQELPARRVSVQHHYAHALSCMADNELAPPVLAICWDGTGYGTDGTIWGGEFLLIDDTSFERFAHLRAFRLPGGEAAVREPRRSALGLLYEIFGDDAFERMDLAPLQHFSQSELNMLKRMLTAGTHAPITSSAGRLFDAVTSLLGLRQRASFEGQAAMELEFAIDRRVESAYAFALRESAPLIVDWQPAILELLDDARHCESVAVMAAKFHNALAEAIVAIARAADQEQIVLTGGCFQNRYLTERTLGRLRKEGLAPYTHRRIPPNDGGISLGQVLAARRLESGPRTQLFHRKEHHVSGHTG